MNIKRSLLCTSLHTPAVVDCKFGPLWFSSGSRVLWNFHECHFTKLLSLINCVSLRKTKKQKNPTHSAYKKHAVWQSLFHTYKHTRTHTHTITQTQSLFLQQSVQWFCTPPPPASVSEVGGCWRKRQQWGKHKNSWEILHRRVPAQNTTVSPTA